MSSDVAVRLTELEARLEIMTRQVENVEAACRRKDQLLVAVADLLPMDSRAVRRRVSEEIGRR